MLTNAIYFIATCFVFAVLCAHIGLDPNCHSADACAAVAREKNIAIAVSEDEKAVDSSALELSLSRLKFDSDGHVLISLGTESILSSASAVLAHNPSPAQWQLVSLVVSNSFPARDSAQLFDLLKSFHAYYHATLGLTKNAVSPDFKGSANKSEKNIDEDFRDKKALLALIDSEIQRQRERELLQLKNLGEDVANKLFSSQNTLARYLLMLRRIDADPALSESQKQQQSKAIKLSLDRLMRELH